MIRFGIVLGLFTFISVLVFSDVEVVVTASRVEEDGRSTPAYVRIIPKKDILQGKTVLDALKDLPDIMIISTSPGQEFVTSGGFGDNGFGRTLVLIDGRPINRVEMSSFNWRAIPLDKVQRIEVVKGAMSSQYGDQAVAGAINIITKSPEGFALWIRNSLALSQSNRQSAGASWKGKNFRGNIGASREDLRPKRKRSKSSIIALNAGVGGSLGIFDLDITGDFVDSNYELPGSISKEQFESNPNQSKKPADEVSEKNYNLALSASAKPKKFAIDVSGAWHRLTNDVNLWSFRSKIYDDVQGSIQGSTNLFFGENIAFVPVLGFDARYTKVNVKIYTDVGRTTEKSNETPNKTSLGVWGRGKLLLGELWVVDLGARLSSFNTTLGSDKKSALPVVFDGGISFVPDNAWAFSVRYGRVFRSPFLDERISYQGFGPTSFNSNLNPEYGHNITASAEFRKGGFQISAAPYFIAMSDEIAYVYDAVAKKGLNKNIGSTYHYGGVLSISWTDNQFFTVKTAYSFDRAQFKDTKKLIPRVPSHTVTGKIAFHPLKWLTFSADGRFSSSFYQDISNSAPMIPSRFVMNARIELNLIKQGFSVYGSVQNLLDNRTPTAAYGEAYYYPSAGREIEFGVSYNY